MYWHIKNEIPGEGVKKGLRYGTAIALLWLFAMLEGVSLFGNPIIKEFMVGLSDAIPVFGLIILLSKQQTEKVEGNLSDVFNLTKIIKTVSIFRGIFDKRQIYRLFSGVIQSVSSPALLTFIWTL